MDTSGVFTVGLIPKGVSGRDYLRELTSHRDKQRGDDAEMSGIWRGNGHLMVIQHITSDGNRWFNYQEWVDLSMAMLKSELPSGKRLHNYGKSPFSMGESTISMVIFNSKLLVYQRVSHLRGIDPNNYICHSMTSSMGEVWIAQKWSMPQMKTREHSD